MKNFSCAVVLVVLLIAVFAQARVVQEGVLQAVYPERQTLVINDKEYRLAEAARIYHQADPEQPLKLSALHRGQRVVFDLSFPPDQEPRIRVLVVQGR